MPIAEAVVLVCTVGGSPAPIIFGINAHTPAFILFICSQGSAPSVEEQILPALIRQPSWRRLILTDEQNLLSCVTDIRSELVRTLDEWALPHDTPLLGDFTGGTKVMSAALVMAMMETNVQFIYTGGGNRSKNGLGIVQNGEEHLISMVNPWEALSYVPIQQMADAFNSYQFHEAEKLARKVAAHGVRQGFFLAFAELSRAYSLWDSFRHTEAVPQFAQGLLKVKKYASSAMTPFIQQILLNETELQTAESELKGFLRDRKPCPSYLCDILANALRRKEQGRYDDTVARLYSVLEKAAKITLLSDYNVDTSALHPEQLPKHVLESTSPLMGHDGSLQLPLFKAYQLLAELGHPLGLHFMEHEKQLSMLLHARNFSLLAHGFEPISEENCSQIQDIIFTFLNFSEDALPTFPKIKASDIT